MGQRLARLDQYAIRKWQVKRNTAYYESQKPKIDKLAVSKKIFKPVFWGGLLGVVLPFVLEEKKKRIGGPSLTDMVENVGQAILSFKDFREIAAAAFLPDPREKRVFVPIAENVWQIRKWRMNMIVYKSPKTGGLIIYSPIALNEEEFDQLSEIGEIVELIIQPTFTYRSHYFIDFYERKFPNAKIVIPYDCDEHYIFLPAFFSASCEQLFSPDNQYDIKILKTGVKGRKSQYIYDIPLDAEGKKRGLLAGDSLKASSYPTMTIEPQPYIPFRRKYLSSHFSPSDVQQSLREIAERVDRSGSTYEFVAFSKGEPITEEISKKLKKASDDSLIQKLYKWVSIKNTPHEEEKLTKIKKVE